jgi:hypothetical protein
MAVNLIDSTDITITQTDNDIKLNVQKDSSVSTSSTKPVENQAITNYVNNEIQDTKDYIDTKTDADSWQMINNWLAYKKCGNIVTIRGYSRNAKMLTANAYTDLGTIPASVRPAYELLSNWAIIGEAKLGVLSIGTNGTVQAFTESGTSYWGFTITYVI